MQSESVDAVLHEQRVSEIEIEDVAVRVLQLRGMHKKKPG
jgi:hypothetical protein